MRLKEHVRLMEKRAGEIKEKFSKIATAATMRAIEKAAELTPPIEGGDVSGTNTRSGDMKQSWASDSDITPKIKYGNRITFETVLANNKEYASYVNDGHSMDRHFVPGLYVNEESGLLEYDPSKNVGIVVGTKTKYVKGLYMADAAKKEYEKAAEEELRKVTDKLK